jgi:hypothetical protein
MDQNNICSGWGVRIRTFIRGVKARCPTVERRPRNSLWCPGRDSNPPYRNFKFLDSAAGLPGQLVRRKGLEPLSFLERQVLSLVCLPFHHPRIMWSGRQDSNLRPSVPKTDALPDCATPRIWLSKSGSNRRPAPCKGAALPLSYSTKCWFR